MSLMKLVSHMLTLNLGPLPACFSQVTHLGCSFLIACCAIDLSRKEQPLHQTRFQGGAQLTWIQIVILNSIAWYG